MKVIYVVVAEYSGEGCELIKGFEKKEAAEEFCLEIENYNKRKPQREGVLSGPEYYEKLTIFEASHPAKPYYNACNYTIIDIELAPFRARG